MTDPCETWSIALEKESHGELATAERAALERHLAGCARCREERGRIASLATGLALADPAGPRTGWDDLHVRLVRAHRARVRETAIGIAAALGVGAILLLTRGRLTGAIFDAFGSGIASGIAAVICVAAIHAWLAVRRFRRATPGTDLIGGMRRYYEGRIRSIRFFAFLGPAYVGWAALTAPKMWGAGVPGLVFRVVLVLAVFLFALRGWFYTRPRLVRELQSLEGR